MQNQEGIGTAFDLEIIVVDDCSKDGTVDILKKNEVIYLSTGENSGGPNKGRNMGLEIATGDYICIADHDDEWKPHKIITLIPYLEKVPIVTSGYSVIDNKDNSTTERVAKTSNPNQNYISYNKNITFRGKLAKSWEGQNIYIGSIIYRSELKGNLFGRL